MKGVRFPLGPVQFSFHSYSQCHLIADGVKPMYSMSKKTGKPENMVFPVSPASHAWGIVRERPMDSRAIEKVRPCQSYTSLSISLQQLLEFLTPARVTQLSLSWNTMIVNGLKAEPDIRGLNIKVDSSLNVFGSHISRRMVALRIIHLLDTNPDWFQLGVLSGMNSSRQLACVEQTDGDFSFPSLNLSAYRKDLTPTATRALENIIHEFLQLPHSIQESLALVDAGQVLKSAAAVQPSPLPLQMVAQGLVKTEDLGDGFVIEY